jgi:hypothetical protein
MNYFRQLKVREKVHLLADFFDYIIIGSGFGASVSALRLTEKGYSVLIIEKGKRYRDQDFARTNLSFWKYLWVPAIRSFGILQISLLKGMMVLLWVAAAWDMPTYSKSQPMILSPLLPGKTRCRGVNSCVHIMQLLGKCSGQYLIPACGQPMKPSKQLPQKEAKEPHSVRSKWECISVRKMRLLPILFSEVPARSVSVVNYAVAAWLAAVIMPRIPCQRIISTSQKNRVHRS